MGGLMAYEVSDAARALARITTRKSGRSDTGLYRVTRIDEYGKAYADVNGTEVPVDSGVGSRPGQLIALRFADGRAISLGNVSDPPSNEYARIAQQKAEEAEGIANEVGEVARATGQHFWYDENGAHVTEQEMLAHLVEAQGANMLLNALGIILRTAQVNDGHSYQLNLASLTPGAVTFFDGEGNETANIMAYFGSDGARIGKTTPGSNYITIDPDSIGFWTAGETEADSVRVAYVDNQRLYIPYTVVLNAMQVGEEGGNCWEWVLQDNGNLSLKWVG